MDIKTKILTYAKMGGVMLIAFFLSSLVSREFFVDYTPAFRPNLPQYIAGRLQDVSSETIAFIPFLNNHQNNAVAARSEEVINGSLQSVPFQSIAKGVQAKENSEMKYVLIKDEEVEWKEYTFQIKGKTMKIKVRNGEAPPSSQRVEELYK